MSFGPPVIESLLGSRYKHAGELLGLSLWLLIPWYWGHTVWRVLLVRMQVLASTCCAVIGALVLSLTLPFCVSSFGVVGALLAAGAGMVVWSVSLLALLRKADPLDLTRALACPGIIVLIALVSFVSLQPWQSWLACLVALFILAGGVLGWEKFTEKEYSLMASLKNALLTTTQQPHS